MQLLQVVLSPLISWYVDPRVQEEQRVLAVELHGEAMNSPCPHAARHILQLGCSPLTSWYVFIPQALHTPFAVDEHGEERYEPRSHDATQDLQLELLLSTTS